MIDACKTRRDDFSAVDQVSEIKNVFNLEEMHKRYEKYGRDPKAD